MLGGAWKVWVDGVARCSMNDKASQGQGKCYAGSRSISRFRYPCPEMMQSVIKNIFRRQSGSRVTPSCDSRCDGQEGQGGGGRRKAAGTFID